MFNLIRSRVQLSLGHFFVSVCLITEKKTEIVNRKKNHRYGSDMTRQLFQILFINLCMSGYGRFFICFDQVQNLGPLKTSSTVNQKFQTLPSPGERCTINASMCKHVGLHNHSHTHTHTPTHKHTPPQVLGDHVRTY